MWIARFTLRHDCILGTRCKKFGVMTQSLDLREEKKGIGVLTSSVHQLIGTEENVLKFISDLRKDPRTHFVEFTQCTLFLIESSADKPVSLFNKLLFAVKPVIIDTDGVEHWEIASHKKEYVMEFIQKVKRVVDEFMLVSIKNTKLDQIYFPKVMPLLTSLQKRALELAVSEGYYRVPKQTNLRTLAKLMNLSLATYQAHLQKAESKVIPDVLSLLK